ncbi:MAG: deoxynucleoside kinase [Taibaiella sp.]|nr:deoxynucleoside kinase [Taibaiella sp.]
MKQLNHIAIAGNIGAGKTTLTQLLARHYKWQPQFESVENNPYLTDFYDDMARWSFNLQVFFLKNRLNQLLEIKKSEHTIIQDRTIYEDARIFAPNLYEMGLMTTRDFENYSEFFDTLSQIIAPPDLIIYLRAGIPKLVDQIQKRGREYEDNIRLDYLKKLNYHYDNWANSYKDGEILIVDIDELDFSGKKKDFAYLIERVDTRINGLF